MNKYTELKKIFEENQDPENAVKMEKYMRNLFIFYGIPTPKRKKLYRDFLKEEKRNKIIDGDSSISVTKMSTENFSIL